MPPREWRQGVACVFSHLALITSNFVAVCSTVFAWYCDFSKIWDFGGSTPWLRAGSNPKIYRLVIVCHIAIFSEYASYNGRNIEIASIKKSGALGLPSPCAAGWVWPLETFSLAWRVITLNLVTPLQCHTRLNRSPKIIVSLWRSLPSGVGRPKLKFVVMDTNKWTNK